MRARKRAPGESVDLANALGAALGRAVEITNLPFDGLIPALKTSKIDAIISSMTATPERAQALAFSERICAQGCACSWHEVRCADDRGHNRAGAPSW